LIQIAQRKTAFEGTIALSNKKKLWQMVIANGVKQAKNRNTNVSIAAASTQAFQTCALALKVPTRNTTRNCKNYY
jgi:hypothetical protein